MWLLHPPGSACRPHPRAACIGDGQPFESASDKASPETPEEPNSVDGGTDGGPIYSMYLKRAEEEDRRTAEGWKEEAEKVFLFVSL